MLGNWAIPVGPIFLLLGFALLLGLLAVLIRLFAPRREAAYRQKEFLSPAERSFLGVLSQAAGDEWRVSGKVRIADVLTPAKGMSRSRWQNVFNARNWPPDSCAEEKTRHHLMNGDAGQGKR